MNSLLGARARARASADLPKVIDNILQMPALGEVATAAQVLDEANPFRIMSRADPRWEIWQEDEI